MARGVACASAALLALLSARVVAAEPAYPTRPVRIVVPQSPGGTTDFTARLIGPRLAERFGQSVVIDNRPGAGSLAGIDLVVKSPADGYTLLVVASSLSIMPSMHKKLPFDPVKDLTPITTLAVYPNLVVVHPAVPADSIKGLIALAKAKPGALNFSSGGTGTGTQLTAELFKSMAGINIVHVPYKGGGPAMTALLAGEVQLMFAAIPSTLPMARGGKLRALAVTSAKRSAAAPEVPSMAEAGVPGYDELTWNGVLAPARLPAARVNKIYGDLDAVLKTPQVRERFAGEGAEPGSMAPAAFAKLIQAEIVKWAKVTREAGIKAE